VDYSSASHEPRTNAVQSETGDDFRVSFESRRKHHAKTQDLDFIRVGEFVKIGRSHDPDDRISRLQCAMPYEIEEITILSGKGWDEKAWHKRFASRRVRGEWFQWCDEIKDAVVREAKWPGLRRLFDAPDNKDEAGR
jgi:hypothetical protein